MSDEENSQPSEAEELQHLKRVSRIKHVILQKYLPAWALILGSRSNHLEYFDCFAGPGRYESEGKPVGGSPLIAVESAIEFLRTRAGHTLALYLVEDKPKQVEQLETSLRPLQPYPRGLQVQVRCADSRSYIPGPSSEGRFRCAHFLPG